MGHFFGFMMIQTKSCFEPVQVASQLAGFNVKGDIN